MRLLCRYAGGLACLVTALALVACGDGPGSQPEPKEIEDSTLAIGKSLEIALGDKFNGSDLTFSAATSKRSVATVTVDDNDTLTVTAVGAGKATITVTAKNSRGEAKQTFTVTVPEDPVNIEDFTFGQGATTHTIRLANKFSGGNLTYGATTSNSSVATVEVNNTTDILTVTAVGAGKATITVTAKNSGGEAKQTFDVTVPPPADADDEDEEEEEEEEEEVPIVRRGARTAVRVAVDATETVVLSEVFDGATSYSATSSDSTIATESGASSGTLTITGAGAGSATITVTGTNTAGSTAHLITATVTAATPTTTTPEPETPTGPSTSTKCPPPAGTYLKIVRDGHAECTLPGQRLISEDPDSVAVKEPSKGGGKDVWIITAKKKGLHRVFVFKGNDKVGEILVNVPNTPPRWTGNPTTPPTLEQTPGDSTTHTTSDLPLTGFFEDADVADHFGDDIDNPEEFTYTVSYAPEGVLVDTENGFVNVEGVDLSGSAAGTFKVAILKRPEDDPFTIELHAHDGEELSDNPVTLTFAAVSPRVLTYSGITQSPTDGSLEIPADAGDKGKLRVSNRIGPVHTIQIAGTGGYTFATQWETALGANRRIATTTTNAASANVCTSSELDGWKNTAPELGTGCYSITSSTKDVEITNAGGSGSTPTTITFKLPSTQRSVNETGDATITITYNVWALPSRKSGTDDVDNDADKDKGRTDNTKSVKLYLDLDKCVKATDCP